MIFSEDEIYILQRVAVEIDEEFGDVRKGIPQSKYVMRVEEGKTYFDSTGIERKVPEVLVGYWMMQFETDLRHTPVSECFDDQWVKCYQKEVTTYEWRELEL